MAVGPAAAGKYFWEKTMIEEKEQLGRKHLTEFVDRLKSAAADNLVCLAAYGSAVSEEFSPDFSDVNLICVVRDYSGACLRELSPVMSWWSANKFPVPLVFSQQEITEASVVFPIEMLDIRGQHHILFGNDIFKDLNVPLDRHRFQLEHDLRTKLLFLRQHYLLSSSDDKRIGHLMLDSVANFTTLFRHTLIVMKQEVPKTKAAVIEQLAMKIQFDPSPFLQLLQIREGKASSVGIDTHALFAGYIQGIGRVIAALGAM
jgi:hypothetical protein